MLGILVPTTLRRLTVTSALCTTNFFSQGEWEDDERNGYGVLNYACGDNYNGEWIDNKQGRIGRSLLTLCYLIFHALKFC